MNDYLVVLCRVKEHQHWLAHFCQGFGYCKGHGNTGWHIFAEALATVKAMDTAECSTKGLHSELSGQVVHLWLK